MTKSRNLSPLDYLDRLQIEWFQNFLRNKIYIDPSERSHYKRVMANKEAKIRDIAGKNEVPSIFTDTDVYRNIQKKVLGECGCPETLTPLEVDYYYQPGQDVKVVADDAPVKTGRIVSFVAESHIVSVKLRGEETVRPYPAKAVTRVF